MGRSAADDPGRRWSFHAPGLGAHRDAGRPRPSRAENAPFRASAPTAGDRESGPEAGSRRSCQLAGEAIPLGDRILAVADTFDALTIARPYRDAKSPAFALDVLTDGADRQ